MEHNGLKVEHNIVWRIEYIFVHNHNHILSIYRCYGNIIPYSHCGLESTMTIWIQMQIVNVKLMHQWYHPKFRWHSELARNHNSVLEDKLTSCNYTTKPVSPSYAAGELDAGNSVPHVHLMHTPGSGSYIIRKKPGHRQTQTHTYKIAQHLLHLMLQLNYINSTCRISVYLKSTLQ